MREFSVPEIETYATRAQASAAFATAINALQSLAGLDIFSSEEQEALAEALDSVHETAQANDARIKVFEEAMSRFETVKPSQKALVALIGLLDGLKAEAEDGPEAFNPTVPIKDNIPKHGVPNHFTRDGKTALCGQPEINSEYISLVLVRDWKQVTCIKCVRIPEPEGTS